MFQSMSGRQHKFSGNVLLYDYLSFKRTPVFLNRNLTRALRVHQHNLEHGNTHDFSGPDHERRRTWKPPSWDDLDDMVEQQDLQGSFVLEIHGLRPLNESMCADWTSPVFGFQTLFSFDCDLEVSIFPNTSNEPIKGPLRL
jgi:hypothetical protein